MNNKEIFENAKAYLLSFPEISNEILDNHITFNPVNSINNIEDLFKRLLEHAKNRQGMGNSIGPLKELENVLYGFSSTRILNEYSDWESLFDTIQTNCKVPGRMTKSNSHNYWVIYCKSIMSIAEYLSNFKTIDEFNDYIKQFITSNPDTRLSLALLLEKELFGFQFALACDFIKENISPEFIKPDVHLRDIFIGLGLSRKNASNFQIYRDAIKFANDIDVKPYTVDKVFWLIGSGNFYFNEIEIKTKKNEFIKRLNDGLGF